MSNNNTISQSLSSPRRLPSENGGNQIKIGIVAGEVSGDLLGAGLIREIKARLPNVVFEGIAGPRMQAEGCRSLYDMDQLSVIGFEGITRVPAILRIRKRLASFFIDRRPDVFIGVDAPDFNLKLEQRLRAAGIRTVHYVSPTVWAWRRYRLRGIRQAVDLMLTLFPFEASYYENERVPVTYVGHPMADDVPERYDPRIYREKLGLPLDRTIIALLPGSRGSELKRHGALFIQTVRWLLERHPGLHFVAPFASESTLALFELALAKAKGDLLPITRVLRRSRDVLAAADIALLASGTATLEAALFKKPMVVTYKVSVISEWLIRTFAHVKMYALPNFLAGRMIVPELMQDDATPDNLGAALAQYLDHPEQSEAVRAELSRIHASLKQNADARAADAVVQLLRERLA